MKKNSFFETIGMVSSKTYEFQLLSKFKKQHKEKTFVIKLENLSNMAEYLVSLTEYLKKLIKKVKYVYFH